MKKLLGLALVAVAFALAPAPANAWYNVQFGIGLGFSWQSGNNHIPHLWYNGPAPHYHPAPYYQHYPHPPVQFAPYGPAFQFGPPNGQVDNSFIGDTQGIQIRHNSPVPITGGNFQSIGHGYGW